MRFAGGLDAGGRQGHDINMAAEQRIALRGDLNWEIPSGNTTMETNNTMKSKDDSQFVADPAGLGFLICPVSRPNPCANVLVSLPGPVIFSVIPVKSGN
jgi:hypothetical protein